MTMQIKTEEKKVLLGLSGGVDSTASASLLLDAGYEVTAVTLWTWQEEGEGEARNLRAARSAELLGIRHILLDVRQAFYDEVVRPFALDWDKGLTPNPCVMCNPDFKFRQMSLLADREKIPYLATGHYARIRETERGRRLMRARVRAQDQSYFLYRLPMPILNRLLFPLGDLSKDDARAIAGRQGDPVSSQKDSQDICFIGKGELRSFLGRQGLVERPGDFVSPRGEVLGQHRGIWRYTVGQRRGLGQSFGDRMTVLSILPEENRIVLGSEEDALMDVMELDRLILASGMEGTFQAGVQLRSQGRPLAAVIETDLAGQRAKVRFGQPVRISSPGQSAVFYDGDLVLGGGLVRGMTRPQGRI